jgi:hypothetical protein
MLRIAPLEENTQEADIDVWRSKAELLQALAFYETGKGPAKAVSREDGMLMS